MSAKRSEGGSLISRPRTPRPSGQWWILAISPALHADIVIRVTHRDPVTITNIGLGHTPRLPNGLGQRSGLPWVRGRPPGWAPEPQPRFRCPQRVNATVITAK